MEDGGSITKIKGHYSTGIGTKRISKYGLLLVLKGNGKFSIARAAIKKP